MRHDERDDFDLEAALRGEGGAETKVMVDAEPVVLKSVPLVTVQTKALVEAQKKRLLEFEGQVEELVYRSGQVIVRDSSTNDLAVKIGALSAKLAKDIDKRMREIIGPANEFVKEVRNFAGVYTDKLKKVKEEIGTKTANYRAIVENERRKATQIADKARQEIQQQINDDAAAAGVEAPIIEAPVVKEEKIVTRTEFGTAYSRKKMVFEIENEALLPREYLMANKKAIQDAVDSGVTEIPGVHIHEETKTVFRT